MTDDAHGIGVVGNGRGSTFAHGAPVDVPLQMGTLSKAIGGYGGYLCASAAVIDLIRNRARTFIYSTGLPPANVAAAIAALDLIERDPAFAAQPLAKAQMFTRIVGLPDAESPIVPIVVGEAEAALAASRVLEAEGFLVVAIRPPTVPDGTARLRFTFTAGHPDDEIARLADIVCRIAPTRPHREQHKIAVL
jgi:8-amino-7-oxononanoate synthase